MLFCPNSMNFRVFHASYTPIFINRSIPTSSTCLQKPQLVQPVFQGFGYAIVRHDLAFQACFMPKYLSATVKRVTGHSFGRGR